MAAEDRPAKDAAARFKIKVTVNGPYLVTGRVPLSEQASDVDKDGHCRGWRANKDFTVSECYALCRCGRSENKPFCDGSHTEANFDGTETAGHKRYLEQVETIRGPALDLTDAECLCAAARFCHRAGGTWKLTERSDDPEARRIAIEEAADCPSGRLVVWDKEGNPIEPRFEPSIVLVDDQQKGKMGPIWVRGGIIIESADGTLYEVRNRVTLCRCGKSKNKPFCDGRHMK